MTNFADSAREETDLQPATGLNFGTLHAVNFSTRFIQTLHSYGVQISHPLGIRNVCNSILIETPCAIAAEVDFFHPFSLGAFSHLNGGYIKNVSIGRYCSLARDVQIGHGAHPTDWLSVSPLQYANNYRGWPELSGDHNPISVQEFLPFRHTIIGHDVWIGNGAFLKDGVTIGNGAIISAGSIVTKNVPPYAIVGGNPARIIRYRFEPEMIERLQTTQWWRFSLTQFQSIDFQNIHTAVDHIERRIQEGIEEHIPNALDTAAILVLAERNQET